MLSRTINFYNKEWTNSLDKMRKNLMNLRIYNKNSTNPLINCKQPITPSYHLGAKTVTSNNPSPPTTKPL